jgi:methylase of polypeptide subunit release factors
VLNKEINPKDYYLHTLRLVYRVLFLLVIEERKLIYPERRDEDLNKKRSVYYEFYSVLRLTKLAEKLLYVDPRKTDLWQSLITTFALFEYEDYGKKLGISPLGAGIFAPNALGVLSQQMLDNETLLKVLRYLVTFENENGQRVRVNYADLDVEEFGSVYEGLLDYDPEISEIGGEPTFGFVKGSDRSSSGSHYTPEELVRPLIKHSLDYLIEDKLKETDPEKGLLSLTICDVACGSGHILLSAARRVGFELAKVRSKEDQPTPSVLRTAVRDVIRNCIYGVDLNPLAVELCKVALWLEAHEPGSPLNFLDHHIKCGNAIVGLAHAEELEKGIASEAFKTLPGDDKEVASSFKKRNDQEVKLATQLSTFELGKVDNELKDVQSDFLKFAQLPESTPEQIAKKEKAYHELTNGKKWWRLKSLADLQVAQFFIPKIHANKEKLTTHSQYKTYLQGTQILDRGASIAISQEKRFFHWFLEFPEVFVNNGFDCVLGNPPYLHGNRISSNYGDDTRNYLSSINNSINGNADFCVHFVKRDKEIINQGGFVSLIVTNSISETDNRTSSFEQYYQENFTLNFAFPKIIWPGEASLYVSLFSASFRQQVSKYIGNKEVKYISPYMDDQEVIGSPKVLLENSGQSFKGCDTGGMGFVLEKDEEYLKNDNEYKKYIWPVLNAREFLLNEKPKSIINFSEKTLNEVEKLKPLYEIILKRVKPYRDTVKDKNSKENWWLYNRPRPALYKSLEKKEFAIINGVVSKYFVFEYFDKRTVFTNALNVFSLRTDSQIFTLQSNIHEVWASFLSSSLGQTSRYNPTDIFETFPFPNRPLNFEFVRIFELRKELMKKYDFSFTEFYNSFHKGHEGLRSSNYYEFVENNDSIVLSGYGWHEDSEKWGKAIQLSHGFHELDYLPENDRVRYTIHPEARKEILKRLLQLNHERYAEEVAAGLHDKKGAKKETKATKAKGAKTVDGPGLFD